MLKMPLPALLSLFLLTILGPKQSAAAAEQVTFTPETGPTGSCSVYKGYDITPGYDLALIFTPTPECCRLCFEREDCVGWTMYEGKCHLKGSNELVKSRDPENTVSGLKNIAGNEASPVFSNKPPQVQSPRTSVGTKATCNLHVDFKIAGQDLKNLGYMYLSECCYACANTAECSGWTYQNWECILKQGTELVASEGDISGIVKGNSSLDVAPSPA